MLVVERVSKAYRKNSFFSKEKQQIVKNVSFTCKHSECLGIIGESGSGKSTLGRLIAGIEKPDHGIIQFDGRDVSDKTVRADQISVVFQDYTSSLNPYYTVEQAMMEPLNLQNDLLSEKQRKLDSLLIQVGLNTTYRTKYPHELSGGEVQRVCIARAISTQPQYIVLDEAVSSLDVSVQTQVLDLLKELKENYGTSYLFITHDIQAAAYLCDRIIIFKEGQIEEIVRTEHLKYVQSDYAKSLLKKHITF
ncbi:peptide ABC transporter ATP-binding protein [Paenibacillus ferrarius]|uniref:Peptide ABC transporter ATP-binding protein n=1 Tax=Paenibacillus ferrarius TaxID=1469647 RepID=A0A1V4HKG8_9BACL|nr:ABC transporter ATP-binding protein [Paenibacillus ferrarius]OPH56929.1 peptide ABC transporter ATP-binding protein [Paenibacillus ferrarius]